MLESETGVFLCMGTPALDSNAAYRRMSPTLLGNTDDMRPYHRHNATAPECNAMP
jgi:hypothetical protein